MDFFLNWGFIPSTPPGIFSGSARVPGFEPRPIGSHWERLSTDLQLVPSPAMDCSTVLTTYSQNLDDHICKLIYVQSIEADILILFHTSSLTEHLGIT
jgi:hypothetical protein